MESLGLSADDLRAANPGSSLEGKVAVVVGAGQTAGATIGNGRAISIQMARDGATVWCLDRNECSALETAELIHQMGGKAHGAAADVADESSIEQAVRGILGRSGAIDILINNVGISVDDAPVEEITVAAYDRIFSVNLRGMALTCKHVLPGMREQRSGSVVNVSSAAAFSIHANVAYKTTKAGVVALTQNLAVTYAPHGVRANCVIPGVIDTPMAVEGLAMRLGKTREEVVAIRNARVPLGGRMGSAWDVAYATTFLASGRAGFITGACLPVDGGQLAFVGR